MRSWPVEPSQFRPLFSKAEEAMAPKIKSTGLDTHVALSQSIGVLSSFFSSMLGISQGTYIGNYERRDA
jgi:hypothetical protein